jgi:hypothetical protein
MRWAFWSTIAFCIFLGIYIASPLLALQRIASAVERRDAIALAERIDLPSLRRSFRNQIVVTYLKLTGRHLPLGAISRRFAVSVADPVVARLITIRALLDLLGKGEAGKRASIPLERAPFTPTSLQSLWRLWFNSDYLGRDFYVYLPPHGSRADQFQIHLRPVRWRWTIVGIELPEELKERLARELIDLTPERLKPFDGGQ